jgi:serine/threonine protein kinase
MENRYTILHKLRETIYGELYRGYDNKEGQLVALKLSRATQGALKRGEDPLGELNILADLSSSLDSQGKDYIIRLHDKFSTSFNHELYYCTVLEYAGGGDLLDRILTMASERRHLTFSQIRRYLTMMAKGLSFIHRHGVSHLDLSLENILLTSTDEIRICDFGQAERKRTIHDTSLRRGKPKYMSPEVYQVQKYDGYKADVWSLGVVLWGMVTGGLIYRKPSMTDHRFVTLSKGREGLTKLLQLDEISDVCGSLLDLLVHMLDLNPETRYSADDVLAHPWLKLKQGTAEEPKKTLEQQQSKNEQKEKDKMVVVAAEEEVKKQEEIMLPPPSSISTSTTCPSPLSPPRPLRSVKKSISTTPTGKTQSMTIEFPPVSPLTTTKTLDHNNNTSEAPPLPSSPATSPMTSPTTELSTLSISTTSTPSSTTRTTLSCDLFSVQEELPMSMTKKMISQGYHNIIDRIQRKKTSS